MHLRLFNSLTRQKEAFIPLHDGSIKMYVCGVTVYDYCHLGHARAYIVWDVVRRYLQFAGYQVQHIQNITDIDDKILHRSREQNISMSELTDRFITAYNQDMARLNVLPAHSYPRATEFIPEMIAMIQSLTEKGNAYAVGGNVYYAVQKFPGYGKLSQRSLDSMQAGASGRVDGGEPLKRYPLDFALWKAAKEGEPYWESPWGRGRPGWHIECSAMVKSCLGNTIDIHAGGTDLQFPHHENEIAQSEAATEQPLARYWLHNGFVNIDGQKMAKSLQNFKTIRSLIEHYPPMALRLFILQAHYRQPIDFTEEAIDAASKAWELIHDGLKFGQDFGVQLDFGAWQELSVAEQEEESYIQSFREAMDDDFNTSVGMSIVFELAKILRKERNILVHQGTTDLNNFKIFCLWKTLHRLAEVLGFQQEIVTNLPVTEIANGDCDVNQQECEIEELITQRKQAKKNKNYLESDRIREQLKASGIELIDLPGGETRWHRLS